MGRAGKGLGRQRFPQGQCRRAAIGLHLGEHEPVVGGDDDDGDARMVLGAGADQGRPADVYVLDAAVEVAASLDRRLEGIEVDHKEVDAGDRVILQRPLMRLVPPHRQQAAVNFRVQRLDPPVHHFGATGDLGDVDHLDPGLAQKLGGAAGRDDLDPAGAQRLGEIGKTGLVADREQRAAYFSWVHESVSWRLWR